MDCFVAYAPRNDDNPRRQCAHSTRSSSLRKAGTHTPCSIVFGAQAETFRFNERRWLWVPAFALGHAHISEAPSCGSGVEVFETGFEGDWTWRLGRWVAIPAAEAADNPGGPSEAV